jgi:outer membrane protein insertion porin family/translocation and assembly module TamA
MRRFRFGLALFGCLLVATACRSAGGIQVHGVKFSGAQQIRGSDLKAVLATQPSSKLPWGRKNYFDRAKFEADLKRIQAFYADRGFPDARVTAFDVRLNKSQTNVDITVHVSEGQPIVVSDVAFQGFQGAPGPGLERLQSRASLRKGSRLDRSALNSTREVALNLLRDNGYPYAKVAIEQQPTSDPKKVDVTFAATPGVKAWFGPIEVAGNKNVGDEIIRRQMLYEPGQLYNRALLLRSQRKLYNLELFQFANIQNLNPEQRPAEVSTRVTVAEAKPRRLQFSAGYGSEEKVRVEGEWRHLNFLGGARQFGVNAKWSSLDHGVRANLNQPYFLGSDFTLGFEVHQWYDDEPAFRQRSSGGRLTFTRQISERTTWLVSLLDDFTSSTISNAALSDPTFRPQLIALGLDPRTGSQTGTLNAIAFDLLRRTAANPLSATKGYYASAHLEQAGHWVRGTFAYTALSGEARGYAPVTRRVVFAARLQYGTIRPSGGVESEVPFFKRLFLGGSDSLRGWGRFEISPLSGSGLPIGGFTLLAGSGEARVNLAGKLGAVAFLDLGNVWADAWRVHLNDLRYDVGPGLRYDTPIGPVRVDLGYQLNPIPGLLVDGQPRTRRWRVHFSIGQAF